MGERMHRNLHLFPHRNDINIYDERCIHTFQPHLCHFFCLNNYKCGCVKGTRVLLTLYSCICATVIILYALIDIWHIDIWHRLIYMTFYSVLLMLFVSPLKYTEYVICIKSELMVVLSVFYCLFIFVLLLSLANAP